MSKPLHVLVSSVSETLFDAEAQSVTIPTGAGVITVLAHHEPIITTIKKGDIVIHSSGSEVKTIAVESGVLEVSNSRATLLL